MSGSVCGSSGVLVFYRCDFALFETKRRDQAMWGRQGGAPPHRLGPPFGLEKCEITALACDNNCFENQEPELPHTDLNKTRILRHLNVCFAAADQQRCRLSTLSARIVT